MTVNLELEVQEALIVLGRISDAKLVSSQLAAIADGDEREIADLTTKILTRVERRLTDAIYPVCRYPREDDICGREYAGHYRDVPYCRFHLDLESGVLV